MKINPIVTKYGLTPEWSFSNEMPILQGEQGGWLY
jgi:hypothetical protein